MSSINDTIRTVAIVGVAGNQGESVARALLATRTYHIRGLTRNPASATAIALKELGVEIVVADLDNGAEAVAEAFKGVWAVYAYTSSTGEKEAQHGKTIVDAAVRASVERFIWSSAIDAKTISNGKYSLPMSDNKVEVERYLSTTPLRTTSFYPGNFLENTTTQGWLKVGADGKSLALNVPIYPVGTVTPWTWVARDIGEAVRVVLKDALEADGRNVDGQTFAVARQRVSFAQLRAIIEEASGLPTTFATIPEEQILAFNPGFQVVCNLLHFMVEFPILEDQTPDPKLVALGAQFGTVKEWAAEVLPRLVEDFALKSQKAP